MDNKGAIALLDELGKLPDFRPNPWTKKFLESLDFTIKIENKVLTSKQTAKLLEIYEQATEVKPAWHATYKRSTMKLQD